MTEQRKNNPIDPLEVRKKELEIEKLELEKEKIGLENKELKKNFWKRNPQVWSFWAAFAGFLTTLLISGISYFYLRYNGTFEFKSQELKFVKAKLELDIKEFTIKNDSILFETNKLKDSLQIFADSFNINKSQLKLAESQKKELEGITSDLKLEVKTKLWQVWLKLNWNSKKR
jgi:hypothetical protein